AALMWIFEIIPNWTTSLLVIVISLLTVSDKGLGFFCDPEFGQLVGYKSIMASFADPVVMLFMGGFVLAIMAEKYGLDVTMGRALLSIFGTKPRIVLLGFLIVISIFSMFMSNTATAAMMLAFLAPVLATLPSDDKGKVGLALSIPVAANLGGIGTPIGTPPNAIALKFLNETQNVNIGFGEWMLVMFPFAMILLFIAWRVLLMMFPFTQKRIELKIEHDKEKQLKPWQEKLVYIGFTLTILLWMTDKVTGVNSNVVAMLPVGLFCLGGIIRRTDLEEINWAVLWMVAGGFALGVALQDTGLAAHLIQTIPFNTWSPILMIVGSGLLCYAMANFISHTATANLLIPILAVAGASTAATLAPYGGVVTLLVGVALGSSLAMVLPISTPPNALAHATGLIEQKQMIRVGLTMGFFGLTIGYIMLICLGKYGLI
ncbi:MAG TPA: dihydroorotate dehydrogenase, partial [Prevotellaceae bacterium]|nr:dihydroorotate dehydrogenase [Prevotellaceae bacterium]